MDHENLFDLKRIRRYSIEGRKSKISTEQFGCLPDSPRTGDFLDSLPEILAGRDLKRLIRAMQRARKEGKPLIWGFGGHLVKVGLAPVLIGLMEEGFVSALVTNGSGIIHDFEIAHFGRTSEDVDTALDEGDFGMAEETGLWMNQAITEGVSSGDGLGQSVRRALVRSAPPFAEVSLLCASARREIPFTVHAAIGTDIVHCHPEISPGAWGEGSHRDFRQLIALVENLNEGGVYLNIGSAVILPEVFLKAVSVVRSAGKELRNFVTANFDFLQQYRPTQNVVKRPVQRGGEGLNFTGHHEIMIPLLAAGLLHSTSSE